MRSRLYILLIVVFILQADLTQAKGFRDLFMPIPQDYYTSVSLELDNDGLIFSSRDRFYTSGVFFKLKHNETLENGDSNFLYNVEYQLGQQIFTPEIVSDPNVKLDVNTYERPYAGWLFFSITQERVAKDRSEIRLGYAVGITGEWSMAEGFQDMIHDIFEGDDGNWDSQIDNRIGFVFTPEYKKDILYSKASNTFYWSVSPYLKGNIGNIFIDAAAGLEIKYGNFNTAFQKDQASDSLNILSLEEWYVWAGMEYKHVFYNYLIEGNLMEDNSDINVDPANGVTHATLGLFLKWKKYAMSYSVTWQSSEVDNSYDFNNHAYGTLLFSYFF